MKRALAPPSWWLMAVGATVAIVAAIVPDVASAAYVCAALSLVVAVGIAARRHAIESRFLLAVAGIGAFYASAEVVSSGFGPSDVTEIAAAALGLAGNVLLIVGLASIFRRRHGSAAGGVFGDGIIIGMGAWVISWIWLIQPRIDGDETNRALAIVSSFYQPAGTITLFLIAVLLFTESSRRPAIWLVSTAILLSLSADLMYALVDAGHVGDGLIDIAIACYIAAYTSAGAAFLHPTVNTLMVRQTAPAPRRVLGRLVLSTSSLVIPVIVLAATGPENATDKMVRSVSALILALAVTARVVQSVQSTSTAQSELLRSAQTDPLTGLPNRSLLLERVNIVLQESWRTSLCPALYFVDLDRFKNINDSLGHAAGDQVLRTVAERLVHVVPPHAMVARLSGDEYVVLDPDPQSTASADLADQLLSVFREPLPLSQGDVFVTASVGVATLKPNAHTSAEDLLRHADTAMYRAKDAGRNCVAIYDESMHERVAHRLAIETALYRALDRRELRLFHQPILDLDSGEVVGFEALMRWQRADGTIVSPAEFIPIAEDTGTIVPIGSWALLEALTQLRRWVDDGVCSNRATMSVNVSPRQLADPNFPAIVGEALTRSGVEPEFLWLEITESMMISEPELALATLRRLRSLGVRMALDDFGTGYSSLSLLQRFPLQRLKIDRAFVQGVADNPNDRALVRTIVAMGRSLGLDMVAEGVESVHQLQVLHDLGCSKAQGYLISHPVPADAMRSTVSALERLGHFPGLRRDTIQAPTV